MAGHVNILLVDDEPTNLDALEAVLDDPEYRVLRANDADMALRILRDHEIAVIVLDIKMPGVTGIELAKLIKGTNRHRQIPIVFVTAYLQDERAVLAGYDVGAVDYLTKPINVPVLKQKVAVFAELFRRSRALADLNETLETRVRERTAELEKSEAALRTANHQKDAFLATLAHELRNPLAPVRTGLDLLITTTPLSPTRTRILNGMSRQVDHMVRLIDDLLDVSRITHGVLELKREATELHSIIELAIETVRPTLDRKRQSCALATTPPMSAWVDKARMSQVVANLLDNASKFSAVGSEIRVELADVAGRGTIHVIDRGAGIPPDQLDRVFEMFARIERSTPSECGGLGVGLALSRRIAELHGATLSAHSPGEGQGATFALEIPLLPMQAESRADAAMPILPGVLSIVVIEDNEDSGDMLAMWLESLGHTVRLARTGPAGLDLVREERPQLVLCDIGLPGMDGVGVCRRVGDLPARPVMVALTGWGTAHDRQRTGDAGFDHHLVKPVAAGALHEIILSVQLNLGAL